jgi:HEAT repeat protein
MGSRSAVPALVLTLEDGHREVRSAAVRSIGRLQAAEAIEPVLKAAVDRRVPRSVASSAALEVGSPVVPSLLRLLTHERATVRSAAVELIGLLDVGAESAPLVARLHDPAPEVRAASARALERIADATATEALVEALRDDDESVRTSAAAALGEIGGAETLEALLAVARGDAFDPARAAAHAAAQLDPVRVREAASRPDAGPFLREAADLVAL